MAKQDTLPPKPKKFFFDVHNFDEDETEIEEEEVEPPPPVFSEEELENARQKAFEEGRQQGLGEAAQSREKHVTSLIENIKSTLPYLIEQEDRRISLYEREALGLAHKIFTALFPALNENHGLDEIRKVIESILKNQRKAPEIMIEVPAGYGEDIRHYIAQINEQSTSQGLCVVKENETLTAGNCRMSWKDGGAVRDIDAIKQKTEKHLQQILADSASMTDNEDREKNLPHNRPAETERTDRPVEPTPQKDDGEPL